MEKETHPVLKWGGIFIGYVLPIWLAAGSLFFFLREQELRDEAWLALDKGWNAALIAGMQSIQEGQSEIMEELATQTLRLSELEAEHKLLLDAVISMQFEVAFSLGKHEGRHEAEQKQ